MQTNLPPARGGAIAYKDKQSNLWLFGGGVTGPTSFKYLGDLWRFKINPNCGKLCSKSIFGTHETSNTDTLTNEVYIPNVFTPNNDASNNLFVIKALNYKSIRIIIFDRWGLKMFESTDFNTHWNGKKNNSGADCPDGTYFYILQLTDKNDKAVDYKGFLNLFR